MSLLSKKQTAASLYPYSRSVFRPLMLQDSVVTVQPASHATRHNKSFISYLFWDLNSTLGPCFDHECFTHTVYKLYTLYMYTVLL